MLKQETAGRIPRPIPQEKTRVLSGDSCYAWATKTENVGGKVLGKLDSKVIKKLVRKTELECTRFKN